MRIYVFVIFRDSCHKMSDTAAPNTLLTREDFFYSIAAGNTAAYEEFVDKYGYGVFIFVTQVTRSKDAIAVMGITIEIFLYLWNHRQVFAVEEKPALFFYHIVFMHLRQYLQQHNDQQRTRLLQAIPPNRRAIQKAVRQNMSNSELRKATQFTSTLSANRKKQFARLACLPAVTISRIHTAGM